MNAITLINVALHVLLLSALGWGMVRWCIPDARHRAWASLLVLLVALIAPLIMEIRGEVAVSATEETPATPMSTWKPDWKISTTVAPPVISFAETVTEPPVTPVWTLTDVAWWTCVLWIAGSVAVALLLSFLSLAAWRWRRSLRSPTVIEMDLLPSSASRYALRVSEREGCPCVVGLWQPVIAVPRQIIGKWSSRQWTWLLRHEGEHVRNRDTLTAWLLGWSKALVWWNPFVHALVEQWSQAREEICDMAAVTGEGDPAAYSSFLLDIAAGNRASSPVLLHMAASRPARRLRARMVAMLAQRRVRERASRVFQFGALATMATIAAIVSCVGLKAEDAPAKEIPKAENPPSNGYRELYTRKYKVTPNFLTSGKAALNAEPDPFSGGKAPVARRMTARDILEQRGIAFPEGASASYVPATSQLIVRNTQANFARIEFELGTIIDEQELRNTQVYVTTHWVELDAAQVHGPVGAQGAGNTLASLMAAFSDILTNSQFEAVIRALSQTKGVNLMTAPSVTTRPGQRATVEVIREFYSKEAAEAAAKGLTEPGPDFIGPRNEILAEFEGGGGRMKLQISGDLGELDKSDPANPQVRHLRQSRTANICDGDTIYLEMGESPTNPGRLVLLFVTARLIQPLGADEAVQRAKRAETMKEGAATDANPPQEVKFITGEKHFVEGDDIVIDKVMCSSGEFKPGDRVVVQGHYRLASIPEAQLALYLTSRAHGGKDQRTQYGTIQRGSGAFERSYVIQNEGSLHLSFYDMATGKQIGGLYFGTQRQVDNSIGWPLDTSRLVNSGRASERAHQGQASPVTPALQKEERDLILAEFAKLGGTIKEKYVDDDINNIIRENYGNDRAAFERELAQKVQSLEEFRTLRREMMIISVMKARATKGLTDPAAKKQAIDEWLLELRRKSGVSAPKTTAVSDEDENRQVDITVWTVDIHASKDEDVHRVLFRAMFGAMTPEAEAAAPQLKNALQKPGSHFLDGVFTPEQHQTVKDFILKRGDIKTYTPPSVTIASGKTANFIQDDGFTLEAEPAFRPDGRVVDLNIIVRNGASAPSAAVGAPAGGITTAVTIWDGCTIVMAGIESEDETGRTGRLLFITAKMKP